MSATIPQQGFTDRIDAEIRAHGRPPVSDEQIAATLASVGAAFRGAAIPRTDPMQEARDRIRAALRELVPVQRRLHAEGDTTAANDVEFAMSELALALDALKDAVTR